MQEKPDRKVTLSSSVITSPPLVKPWVDRLEEMTTIQSWIDDADVNLIGIVGLGGIGKSALVAYFYNNFFNKNVETFHETFLQNKFWADVSLNPDFAAFAESIIKGLSGTVNATGDVNILIADLFRILHNNRCLLVVDNIETLLDESGEWQSENYATFFQRWKQQGHTSILLLTTRDKPNLYRGDNNWYSLGRFTVDEGKTLLKGLQIEGSDQDLENLVTQIDGHALTLRLVASYLKEYCDSQLNQVKELGLDEFELIYNEASGLHRNKTDARLSWILEQHLDRLSEKKRQFLVNLSVYRQPFDVTAATGMYINANFAEGETEENIKPIEVKKELQNLLHRSLLSRSNKKGYECPLLLKPYLQKKYSDLTNCHQTAINYYLSVVPPKPWKTLDEIQGYLEIFYHYYQLGEYDTAFDYLHDIDQFMTFQGYYHLLVEYYSDLIRGYKKNKKKDNRNYAHSLNNLGDTYNLLGQYKQAIEYFQQSLAIFTEIGDREGEARSYTNLGNAYNYLKKYQQAIEYSQQSLTIYKEIGEHKSKANCYNNLGITYESLRDYEQSIQYYEKSLAIAIETDNPNIQEKSYNNLGLVYNSLGKYQSAIEYYEKSLAICTELGDRPGEASSYINLGSTYYELQQYEQAIECYQHSLAIDIEINNHLGKGDSYLGLGNAYYSLKQYEKAIQYHQQYLDISTDISNRNGEAIVYHKLGSAYNSLGQYQQAIEYYQQSLAIKKEIGNRKGEAISYNKLGSAYNSLGQYQQAIEYHQFALQLFQQLGNPHDIISCLENLGKTYFCLKQYSQARDYYQATLEIKRRLEDKEGEARTLITLSKIYSEMGKVKEGYALCFQGSQILQELDLPLSEMPYPQWFKSLIQFGQQSKLQLILCFVFGIIAFPFALVGFILLLIWRRIKGMID